MSADPDEIPRLRAQRNRAAWGACLLVAISMAVVLPGFLRARHQRVAAEDELSRLQAAIVSTQSRTREVEARILRTQDEIRALIQPGR